MNWLCLTNLNTLFSNYSSNKRLITLSSDPVSSIELRVKGFLGFSEFFACFCSSEIWLDNNPFLIHLSKKVAFFCSQRGARESNIYISSE